MLRSTSLSLAGLLVLGLRLHSTPAADTLEFQEVFNLLKSQMPALEESALGDLAARGLIDRLHPKVQLLDKPSGETPAPTPPQPVVRVFDGHFAQIRLVELHAGDAGAVRAAWESAGATNQLQGLILDLRGTQGDEYPAAVSVADLFFNEARTLVDWGAGMQSSTAKTNAIPGPVVVLINEETSGAPEALAGALRLNRQTLLLGAPTAGAASMFRDFTLTTGQQLRVAVEPIRLGESGTMGSEGLRPDLTVTVPFDRQLIWIEDPYHVYAAPSPEQESASSSRRRLSEADLVRMMREGELPDIEEVLADQPPAPTRPLVQDPVLARALDFLRGLSVVNRLLQD